MWKFISIVWLAIATPVVAQDDRDWETRTFDFADPPLNFTTDVVLGAVVNTAPMNVPDAGAVVNITNIGRVTEPRDWLEISIVGYALNSPAVAEALCKGEIAAGGYEVHNIRSVPNLTMAEAFATKSNGARLTSGSLSRCYARGSSVLAVHVLFDVADVTTQDDYQMRRLAALDVYKRFTDGMSFADGRPAHFGEQMQDIAVTIGDQTMRVGVPAIWDVAFNDFTGALPAEMQLIRADGDGPPKGLMWLYVFEGRKPVDLAEVAVPVVTEYFQALSDEPTTFDVTENVADDDLPDLMAQRLRINVGEVGDIEANVIWHDGRVYVIGLWQNFAPATDRTRFFSRLPGQSSFLMLKNSLVRSLQ